MDQNLGCYVGNKYIIENRFFIKVKDISMNKYDKVQSCMHTTDCTLLGKLFIHLPRQHHHSHRFHLALGQVHPMT